MCTKLCEQDPSNFHTLQGSHLVWLLRPLRATLADVTRALPPFPLPLFCNRILKLECGVPRHVDAEKEQESRALCNPHMDCVFNSDRRPSGSIRPLCRFAAPMPSSVEITFARFAEPDLPIHVANEFNLHELSFLKFESKPPPPAKKPKQPPAVLSEQQQQVHFFDKLCFRQQLPSLCAWECEHTSVFLYNRKKLMLTFQSTNPEVGFACGLHLQTVRVDFDAQRVTLFRYTRINDSLHVQPASPASFQVSQLAGASVLFDITSTPHSGRSWASAKRDSTHVSLSIGKADGQVCTVLLPIKSPHVKLAVVSDALDVSVEAKIVSA